ncbi:helix-turn-helix domain-containing protein [Commensalibacter nepenthis]|uniref:LysR family transcriptional regulator n=1 Tax=Commensalibacter nepenthis TaxID=3043872 RepID=A0ABT6Q8F9_9PROT|nr:LysR family transcriptional regulator [Commensalibacter sp. TBRC 10068]MDI2112533.1 LysR family transcriptional regulator [Commensalibacter sp. TBRC 10068]
MLDRITSMQIFVKVVNAGSFFAAGRAFHLSPTMVTKHINALEQRLIALCYIKPYARFL